MTTKLVRYNSGYAVIEKRMREVIRVFADYDSAKEFRLWVENLRRQDSISDVAQIIQ